jgi:release factor glutamine methyltransferase
VPTHDVAPHPWVEELRAGITIALARRILARTFAAAGLETPDLDARILVGHALGFDHAALAAQADRTLAAADIEAVAALAGRRIRREPVARIRGVKEFWGLPFKLNAETLVPRPESETVVAAALEAIGEGSARARGLRIADLGTGSGALLLALLSELSTAQGVGTDVNLAALVCARENAGALGLAERAWFVACDYGTALVGRCDLIVSNPPYIARRDLCTLAPEVQLYDPSRALDGGADGLDGYRAIVSDGRRLLAPGGLLVLELSAGSLAGVTSLVAVNGLAVLRVRHDLSGIARALVVRHLP